MRITPQNFVNHELIGLHVTLVKSTNKDAVGLSGRIIDESRNISNWNVADRKKRPPSATIHLNSRCRKATKYEYPEILSWDAQKTRSKEYSKLHNR